MPRDTPAAHMARPCENCPYRMDAPRKLWDRAEFVDLLKAEADPIGKTYACHKQVDLPPAERGFCAGWLLDQKKRGVPSIRLRICLITEPGALEAFHAVTADDLDLFPSVAAMCRANGVRPAPKVKETPREAAIRRALAQIEKPKRRRSR